MRQSRSTYIVGLAALLAYFRCTVGDPSVFGPVDTPVVHHFALAPVAPGIVSGSVAVAVFHDGYAEVDGALIGGPADASYVLHLHRGACGSDVVVARSGPAPARATGPSTAVTDFPIVSVGTDVLDGTHSADVHRVGESDAVACGALR